MVTDPKTDDEDDEAFLRSVTWCEEDLRRMHPHFVGKRGSFRWFMSPNIIPLENYRKRQGRSPT